MQDDKIKRSLMAPHCYYMGKCKFNHRGKCLDKDITKPCVFLQPKSNSGCKAKGYIEPIKERRKK